MLKEIERFTAKEPNGKCYTVSCFQEFLTRKTAAVSSTAVASSRFFKTSEGIFLKAIDDVTFNILGTGKMLYKADR